MLQLPLIFHCNIIYYTYNNVLINILKNRRTHDRIGSASKQFKAEYIMLLAEKVKSPQLGRYLEEEFSQPNHAIFLSYNLKLKIL